MPAPLILVNGASPPTTRPAPLPATGTKANGTITKGTLAAAVTLSVDSSQLSQIGSVTYSVIAPEGSACVVTTPSPTRPFSTTIGPFDLEGRYYVIAYANGDAVTQRTVVALSVPTVSAGFHIPNVGEQTEWDPIYGWLHDYRAMVLVVDALAAIGGVGTLGGDAVGTIASNRVTGIGTGASAVAIHATTLRWDASLTPVLTQAQLAGTGVATGGPLLVQGQQGQAQAGGAANNNGGPLVLAGGLPGTGGAGAAGLPGTIQFKDGAIALGVLSNNSATLETTFATDSSRAGLVLGAQFNNGYVVLNARGTGGLIYLDATSQVNVRDGSPATAFSIIPNASGATILQFASGVTPSITQAQSGSGAGTTMSITAQAAKTGSAAAGGRLTLGSGAGDGAGLPGTIQFKDGAVTLGTFSNNSATAEATLAADSSRAALVLSAGYANGYIVLNARGTNGLVYVDSALQVNFRDASPGTAFSIIPNSAGATTLQFASGTTPSIAHSTPTSDVTPHDLTIGAQSAFATATGANLNAANVLIRGGQRGTGGLRGGVKIAMNGSASSSDTMLEVREFTAGERHVGLCTMGNMTLGNLPVGSGDGVLWIGEANTSPTVAPGLGAYLYVDAVTGRLMAKGRNGTLTTLAVA